jgi:hypothetical protein
VGAGERDSDRGVAKELRKRVRREGGKLRLPLAELVAEFDREHPPAPADRVVIAAALRRRRVLSEPELDDRELDGAPLPDEVLLYLYRRRKLWRRWWSREPVPRWARWAAGALAAVLAVLAGVAIAGGGDDGDRPERPPRAEASGPSGAQEPGRPRPRGGEHPRSRSGPRGPTGASGPAGPGPGGPTGPSRLPYYHGPQSYRVPNVNVPPPPQGRSPYDIK